MDGFAINGLAGIPRDPRPPKGESGRKVDGSGRDRSGTTGVSYEGGELARAIENRKTDLLESPFLRSEAVESARQDFVADRLTSREAVEGAAERLLSGDDAEGFEAGDLGIG